MTSQNKLTCLIIEDEPIAAEVLEDYINQVSFLELKAICKDAVFALEYLQNELGTEVDLDSGGKIGEFTVWVDDKLLFKKKLIQFPSKEEILAKVRDELEES